MKTILITAGLLLIVSCASRREIAASTIANEVIFAEFHEGGMSIGDVSDPLAIANWQLRIAANGAVEQRLYDESANRWRIFEGSPVSETELASIIAEGETLPLPQWTNMPAILGRVATDTTYLHIVLHGSGETRDVMAFAPARSKPEFAQFLHIWRRIAKHRPILQSPGG